MCPGERVCSVAYEVLNLRTVRYLDVVYKLTNGTYYRWST